MRFLACCAAAGALLTAGPGLAQAAPRGTLLDATHIAARHGTDAYRLRYATTAADGRATSASTLLVVPRGGQRPATVLFEHGTIARRSDAPSRGLDSLASAAAVQSAGKGFVTVAPDYLGLGAGLGRQAYLQARTEASASMDALRAARTFAHRHGRRLPPRVLATGFSQGGQAAMAFGRALQSGPAYGFRLGALAPISGPYDLLRVELPAILDGTLDERLAVYNVSLLLTSWRALYGLPGDAFRAEWAARVRALFDGRHGDPQILAALPAHLGDLLTAAQLQRLQHPTGALLRGLRANDATCDWRPRVPVRLYAASGDRVVAFANTGSCAAQLRAHGARVRLFDLGGDVDHFPSLIVATPQVLDWFAALAPAHG
jgi:hypothetical protein